jgi:hypothetical protein
LTAGTSTIHRRLPRSSESANHGCHDGNEALIERECINGLLLLDWQFRRDEMTHCGAQFILVTNMLTKVFNVRTSVCYGGCNPAASPLTRCLCRQIVGAMLVARTILAVLIAISIAVVPATGGAVFSANPAEMSMGNQADMPCCPAPDDSKGSVACAFKCLSFVAAMFPAPVVLSPVVEVSPQSLRLGALHGHVSPPAHPPPI